MALTRDDRAPNAGNTRRGSGGSFGTPAPTAGKRVTKYATAAAVAPPAPIAPSGGGGGGGYDDGGGYVGGFAAPAAPPPPPRRSLADVIAEDFGLRQQREENARMEQEFEAETGRLRGETEREQGVRRQKLQTDLGEMSLDSSEDLASRGLLNSGGLFLNQDKINAEGAQRENGIAELLTNFLSQRGQGLTQLQSQGRNALNERINQITQQYGAGQLGF